MATTSSTQTIKDSRGLDQLVTISTDTVTGAKFVTITDGPTGQTISSGTLDQVRAQLEQYKSVTDTPAAIENLNKVISAVESGATPSTIAPAITGAAQTAVQSVQNAAGQVFGTTVPATVGALSPIEAQKITQSESLINSSTQQTTSTAQEPVDSGTIESTMPRPENLKYNNLHNFTSYTYRITLYLLTAEDYNQLAETPTTFVPKHPLISTGGGRSSAPWKRHPDFLEDFFIDNLSLTTVVGLNARTKASNAIEISFNIVEPFGMTLLDRLCSACEVTAKVPNYTAQPYLLEIDFLSNIEENNNNSILIDRKRMAIKILELKIKPGTGGTEYRVRAVPFNHTAFSESVAALPINLAIEASTVGEFFGATSANGELSEDAKKIVAERVDSELEKWKINNFYNYEVVPTEEQVAAKRAELYDTYGYSATSLPGGYNDYMLAIAKKAKVVRLPPTLISFNVAAIFKDSPITQPAATNASKNTMTNKVENIGETQTRTNNNFKKSQLYNIHAGTDIVTIIDRVMRSSDYIVNQVKGILSSTTQSPESGSSERATQNNQEYKVLEWYKITPQVKLKEFDSLRNSWSKQVIYNIDPYYAINAYHPDFKKTKIKKEKIIRTYNYLYTGKNQDIIGIDIDFDFAYYSSITTYQRAKVRDGSRLEASDVAVNATDAENRDPESTKRNYNPPISHEPINSHQQNLGVNRGQRTEDVAVDSLVNSLYTTSRGDMLNIKLKIVGDPSFIKQDDVYFNSASPEYATAVPAAGPTSTSPPINPTTGQIIFDSEQVLVQLLVKSATDIDDSTGITNKNIKLTNGRMTDGTFSGVYRILTVRSDFSRGKFEQTLDMIRIPDNLFDESLTTTEAQSASSSVNTETNTTSDSTATDTELTSRTGIEIPDPTSVLPGITTNITELKDAAATAATPLVQASDVFQSTITI